MSHSEQALAVARGLGRDTSGAAAHIAALAATLECGNAYAELTAVRGLCASFAPGRALLLPDDGHTLGVDLLWQCEHETAAAILDRLRAASRFN